MHLYSGLPLNSGFFFGTWFVFSSVPETMVFLVEFLMSILCQQNSVIGTKRTYSNEIFNDFNFTE